MRVLVACFAVISVLSADRAGAEPWPGWDELEEDFARRMQAQVTARLARQPNPIQIRWKPRRIADFDFGNPVLAAVAVDMIPGGHDELVLLTTTEVVVLGGLGARRVEVLARLDLDGPAAIPAPRDPLGTIAVVADPAGTKLLLRSSSLKHTYEVAAKMPLKVSKRLSGIPLCPPLTGRIVAGRNLLIGNGKGLPPLFHAARCVRPFYDESARATRGWAVLDTASSLAVKLEVCAEDGSCVAEENDREVSDVGSAFSAADLDRDGRLEVVSSAAHPGGTRERITIYESTVGSLKVEYKEDFALGAAAVVIGQFDGDEELEVVSLHRRFRRNSVEVWLWN